MLKRLMRICILPICFCFFSATLAFAWSEYITHPEITEYAARGNSSLNDYLKNYLGFDKGILTILNPAIAEMKDIKNKTIINFLRYGATVEDEGYRGYNHFHEPINDAKLHDWVAFLNLIPWYITGDYTNQNWATQDNTGNDYSWIKARQYYIDALTASDTQQRDDNFAKTFRSVGQAMHLIEDMAVPAHTRNDMKGHMFPKHWHDLLFKIDLIDMAKADFGNTFEYYVVRMQLKKNTPNYSYNWIEGFGSSPAPSFNKLRDFWDADQYKKDSSENVDIAKSLGNGLAEYSGANFFSSSTIFSYTLPHPGRNDTDYNSVRERITPIVAEDGISDNVIYIKKTVGEEVEHLVSLGIFAQEHKQHGDLNIDQIIKLHGKLDDVCHHDYAQKLIPKATGYAAGVLDYFFRGTLEVCPPNRYVYSIADGSLDPQEFTYIKANVRNATDYNGGPDAPMGPGKLWAVAKYKVRTNYDPNLVNDPPTAGDRTADFWYSVSEPINDVNLSVDLQEFEFDFSGNPIPAGITDLILQVVYQGTLGNELDTAVAVGMKDLNEPMHVVLFNATDRIYYELNQEGVVESHLETAAVFRANNLIPYFIDCCPENVCKPYIDCTPCIDPFDVITAVGFYPSGSTAPIPAHVVYNPMPTGAYPKPPYQEADPEPLGAYGRIIILTDTASTESLMMHIKREVTADFPCTHPEEKESDWELPRIVCQEDSANYNCSASVKTFRGIKSHLFTFFSAAFPGQQTLIMTVPWPLLQTPPVPIGEENIHR